MTNKPFETLRDGAIKATIWKNTTEKGDFYTVDIVRGYKDKNDQWKDSTSFSGAQLLRVANLTTQAYNLIREVEQYRQPEAEGTSDQFQQNASGGNQ